MSPTPMDGIIVTALVSSAIIALAAILWIALNSHVSNCEGAMVVIFACIFIFIIALCAAHKSPWFNYRAEIKASPVTQPTTQPATPIIVEKQ